MCKCYYNDDKNSTFVMQDRRDLFRTVGLILSSEDCLHTFYITISIVTLTGTLLKQFSISNKARVSLFKLKLFSKCGWFCGMKFLPV